MSELVWPFLIPVIWKTKPTLGDVADEKLTMDNWKLDAEIRRKYHEPLPHLVIARPITPPPRPSSPPPRPATPEPEPEPEPLRMGLLTRFQLSAASPAAPPDDSPVDPSESASFIRVAVAPPSVPDSLPTMVIPDPPAAAAAVALPSPPPPPPVPSVPLGSVGALSANPLVAVDDGVKNLFVNRSQATKVAPAAFPPSFSGARHQLKIGNLTFDFHNPKKMEEYVPASVMDVATLMTFISAAMDAPHDIGLVRSWRGLRFYNNPVDVTWAKQRMAYVTGNIEGLRGILKQMEDVAAADEENRRRMASGSGLVFVDPNSPVSQFKFKMLAHRWATDAFVKQILDRALEVQKELPNIPNAADLKLFNGKHPQLLPNWNELAGSMQYAVSHIEMAYFDIWRDKGVDSRVRVLRVADPVPGQEKGNDYIVRGLASAMCQTFRGPDDPSDENMENALKSMDGKSTVIIRAVTDIDVVHKDVPHPDDPSKPTTTRTGKAFSGSAIIMVRGKIVVVIALEAIPADGNQKTQQFQLPYRVIRTMLNQCPPGYTLCTVRAKIEGTKPMHEFYYQGALMMVLTSAAYDAQGAKRDADWTTRIYSRHFALGSNATAPTTFSRLINCISTIQSAFETPLKEKLAQSYDAAQGAARPNQSPHSSVIKSGIAARRAAKP